VCRTAPQQSSWASDDTGYDEPDEELYMTNRDALRKSLERQQATELRRSDLYSSRVVELRRKLKVLFYNKKENCATSLITG
jgi:predicted acetyltransferase